MTTTGRKYELYSDSFRADPYAVFAQMREHDPVLCQPGIDGETPIWFVTRHDDVAAVLLDEERFVRDPRLALTGAQLEELAGPPVAEAINNHMLNRDGDDHRRLRRLVTKAFTPRMVEQLRPRIQEIADELIDAVAGPGSPGAGSMDLAADSETPSFTCSAIPTSWRCCGRTRRSCLGRSRSCSATTGRSSGRSTAGRRRTWSSAGTRSAAASS